MEVSEPSRKHKSMIKKEKDEEYVPDLDFSETEDEGPENAVPESAESKKTKKRIWEIDGRAPLRVLQKVPHECFVAFNYTDDKHLENVECHPSFGAAYPRAIYVPKATPNCLDPCHRRPRQYANHQTSLNRYRAFYQSQQKKKSVRSLQKKGAYPSIVFRYAELLASNPDPFFSGRYDWYYTGGNLAVFPDNNTAIHVDGSDLLVSEITTNATGMKKLKPKVVQIFDEDEKNEEIFEIQPAPSSRRITFSVRNKNAISVHECNNELKCNYSFTQDDVPFISSAFDPYESNHFITSDLNKTVALWDLNRSTKKPKQLLFNADINEDEKDKNWNCICPFGRDMYAFAGLNNLTLLDARVSLRKSSHTFASLEHAIEMCEMFCSLCPSKYENMLYVATTHKIFGLDMRYLGREINKRFTVMRWVHMLRNPPLMLKTYHMKDYELIHASSPISGDRVFCENIKNSEGKFTSPSLPFTPPSLLDAYESARSRGQCLNPNAQIKERVEWCTTGMTFLEQNEALFSIFSTSNGDVFSQMISFANSGIPPSQIENSFAMSMWEDEILNAVKNTSLNINRIEDLSVMSKVFRCMRLNNPEPEESLEEPARPRPRQKWNKPIKNLYKYKDALAESLLSIWDVMPEEEKLPTIKTENQNETTKVMNWLLDSTSLPCPEEDFNMPQLIFDKSPLNITPLVKTEIEDDLMLFKPKMKPKRERHVPGF